MRNSSVAASAVFERVFLARPAACDPCAGIARSEFEYRIPLDEAQALLDGLDPGEVIEKKRFTFEENGDVWEVDEFMGANEGLIVAEIELESEEQDFVRPGWLGAEVSKISRYLNVELSKLPYKAWDSSLKSEN